MLKWDEWSNQFRNPNSLAVWIYGDDIFKATETMSESREALDEWADKVAALEPEVSNGIAAYAKRLAADRRLRKADREFAEAQVKAIRRAVRRAAPRSG